MSDDNEITAAKLRIVVNNGELVPTKPKARPKQRPGGKDLYGQAYLARITNRAWDRFPRLRCGYTITLKSNPSAEHGRCG